MNMKRTNKNAATPATTRVVGPSSERIERKYIKGFLVLGLSDFGNRFRLAAQDLDIILRANNARNANRFSCRYRGTAFRAGRGGVARATLNVRNLTDTIGRNGGYDGCGLPDQISDPRFTRTLGMLEHGVEEQERNAGHGGPGDRRNRRADPDISCSLNPA